MCLCYRTEKDKAPKSPYLTISYNGDVEIKKHQVLVSTCRMHIYTFPFDIQSCNLSFKSVIYTGGNPVFGDIVHFYLYLYRSWIKRWISLMNNINKLMSLSASLLITSILIRRQPQPRILGSNRATTRQKPRLGLWRWWGRSMSGCSSTFQSPPKTPVIWTSRTLLFTL